jgi:hypothetical protein
MPPPHLLSLIAACVGRTDDLSDGGGNFGRFGRKSSETLGFPALLQNRST